MLTEQQQIKLKEAIGAINAGNVWPKMTDDPEVNCAIDYFTAGSSTWNKLSNSEKAIYREEAARFKQAQAKE